MQTEQIKLMDEIQLLEDALTKSQTRARKSEHKMTQLEIEHKALIVKFQKYKEKVFLMFHSFESNAHLDPEECVQNIKAMQDQFRDYSLDLAASRERILSKMQISTDASIQNMMNSSRGSHRLVSFFEQLEHFQSLFCRLICRIARHFLLPLLSFTQLQKSENQCDDICIKIY